MPDPFPKRAARGRKERVWSNSILKLVQDVQEFLGRKLVVNGIYLRPGVPVSTKLTSHEFACWSYYGHRVLSLYGGVATQTGGGEEGSLVQREFYPNKLEVKIAVFKSELQYLRQLTSYYSGSVSLSSLFGNFKLFSCFWSFIYQKVVREIESQKLRNILTHRL